ncbi:MAG TPA: hypothetical protein VER55_01450 [Ardenticatenaceae bacterium]|nr:hypothetical protein [Ardenticatenaceae bacterium]
MSRPLLVLENLQTNARVRLGRLWGVRVSATRFAWLNPVIYFLLGVVLTFPLRDLDWPARLAIGFRFMLAVAIALAVHALGHIASGKLVGSPMDELVIASTRGLNVYEGDQRRYPRRVHLGRALGGPVANLIVAGLVLVALQGLAPGSGRELVERIVSVNLFLGLGSFLPLPSVDGEVIWRELLQR